MHTYTHCWLLIACYHPVKMWFITWAHKWILMPNLSPGRWTDGVYDDDSTGEVGQDRAQNRAVAHMVHVGAWSNLNANFWRHSTLDVHLFCVIKNELCIFHIEMIIWVDDNGHYLHTGPFRAVEVGCNWTWWRREIKTLCGRKMSMFILCGESESCVQDVSWTTKAILRSLSVSYYPWNTKWDILKNVNAVVFHTKKVKRDQGCDCEHVLDQGCQTALHSLVPTNSNTQTM